MGDINEQYDIVMGLLCDSVKMLLILLNSKNMKNEVEGVEWRRILQG